jgi:hypothetical protein
MLKEILSISGKAGLYKLISQGNNMFIAESLIDRKRIPVYAKDKVISLGDISIFTDDEETPLSKILDSIKQKENGEQIDFNPSIQKEELKNYFAQVLPNFDRDRVYPSDIKKIMGWYNLLVKNELTDFIEADKEEQEEQKEEVEQKEE